jgi:L-alanine-DL-glutamate epimerase-like enolase superfamily enzyme
MRSLNATAETFPIRGSFTISRGSRTESRVIVATITDGGRTGRGECVPYARYGESLDSVRAQIESVAGDIAAGAGRERLRDLLPPGAARNAIDCALFDLEAKSQGVRAWDVAGITAPVPCITAFTISLGVPEAMAEATAAAGQRPLLKVKLGGEGDIERMRAVRAAAPEARLIVDANEAWSPAQYPPFAEAAAGLGVELIEQPFPAGEDAILGRLPRPVPVCADESCHDRASLDGLDGRYDFINIKLDKTGGLTEALELAAAARARGLGIMVGCMLGTSLAMAPAVLVASAAGFVDLDGPLLLALDRDNGLSYKSGLVHPPEPELWG